MFVAFDFDGTLADTYPLFREAFDGAARELNVSLYRREDETYIRTLEAMDVLRFHGVGPDIVMEFVGLLKKGMEARRDEAKLFPEISEVLRKLLKDGHPLALLSSNSSGLAYATLGELSADFSVQRFDISLRDKASALRELVNVEAGKLGVCYIGDEIRDADAAKASDVSFGGVTWGYNTEEALRGCGVFEILRSPSDIVQFVNNLSVRTPGR